MPMSRNSGSRRTSLSLHFVEGLVNRERFVVVPAAGEAELHPGPYDGVDDWMRTDRTGLTTTTVESVVDGVSGSLAGDELLAEGLLTDHECQAITSARDEIRRHDRERTITQPRGNRQAGRHNKD